MRVPEYRSRWRSGFPRHLDRARKRGSECRWPTTSGRLAAAPVKSVCGHSRPRESCASDLRFRAEHAQFAMTTDEYSGYRLLKWAMPHKVVKHSGGEYVRGVVHTSTIEGFWSLIKRG